MPPTRTQVFRRYRQVLQVLTRHGFWGPVSAGLGGPGRGDRLRLALEELGPAYVKVGQLMSTRGDLLPPDIVAALESLQDRVPPVPFAAIRQVLDADLGPGCFAHVDEEPLAAASLAQVHRAVLPDGKEVVVKVQRPRAADQVALDLHVLQGLATLAARRTRWGRQYDLPGIAREFAAVLRSELDYTQEGRNAERLAANLAGEPLICFPAVHWSCTTRRVLTLERVGGLRVTDREGLRRAGIRPAAVAGRLAGAIFTMALRDGFFHADPHPGNLFVAEDGTLIFVDMGMVGELTPAMMENVIDYVIGVVTEDSDQVVEAILRMGVVRRAINTADLRREVERFRYKYGDVPLKQLQVGPALRETLAMARRFEISFPTPYAVLLKTLTTLEAVCRQIDPDATLVGLAAPHAALLRQGRLEPERLLARVAREAWAGLRYAVRLPRQASRVLGLMEEGHFRMRIVHDGLDPALARLSAIANRLALAILLASLIIGTALVSASSKGPSLLTQIPIADAGFLLIGAVGVWLVLSILFSGRA